jgi:hypothetical protein
MTTHLAGFGPRRRTTSLIAAPVLSTVVIAPAALARSTGSTGPASGRAASHLAAVETFERAGRAS